MSGDPEHKYFADGMVGRDHRRAVAVHIAVRDCSQCERRLPLQLGKRRSCN